MGEQTSKTPGWTKRIAAFARTPGGVISIIAVTTVVATVVAPKDVWLNLKDDLLDLQGTPRAWVLGIGVAIFGVVGVSVTFWSSIFRKNGLTGAQTQEIKDAIAATQKGALHPDPTSEAAIREALERMAASGDARKEAALTKAATGDVTGASGDLERLGLQQRNAVKAVAAKTAETFKEAGALAYNADTHRAVRNYEAARELTPNDPGVVTLLGNLYRRLGQLDDANVAYRHVLETSGMDDKSWHAAALGNLGIVAQTRGDLDDAEDLLKRSLALCEQIGDLEGQAATLISLGTLAHRRSDLDNAEGLLKRSLDLFERLRLLEGQAAALANLGIVAQTRGNLDNAEGFFNHALTLYEQIDSLEGQAATLANLGTLAQTRGDLDDSEDFLKRSFALFKRLGSVEGQADQLANLGNVAQTRGDLDAAEDFLNRALALHEQLGSIEGQAAALGNLGAVAKMRGNQAKACERWALAHAIYARMGHPNAALVEGWMRDAGCP